ncbi:MAG: GNAT family N-acetyltransferase [Christensenellales bacterium]|jgi:GNAT superfamily N-acetyltransferase
MSELIIQEIANERQIHDVSELAHTIWQEHFAPLLKPGQVDYMLQRYQSPAAIRQVIQQEGYRYYFLIVRDERIGYMAVCGEGEILFLSKLYIKKERRGQGYSRKALEFLQEYAEKNGHARIRLNCYRHNGRSLAAYEKLGFMITDEEHADIGNGYVLNDYILEKSI